MFSLGLYTLLVKSTRLSYHLQSDKSFIDNMYCNKKNNHILNGILINDISDNFMISIVFNTYFKYILH